MKWIVLLPLTALSLASFALVRFSKIDLPSRLQRVNFEPSEQGLRDLQMPLNIMAASPQIEFVDRQGKVYDSCSSSVVSDNGTVLTAGHCIEQCLQQAGAVIKEENLSIVDRATLPKVDCLVKINGEISKAEILATHDCRGQDSYSSGNSKVRCRGLDFAVLKITSTALSQAPCHHLARTAPPPDTEVAGVGFPPATYRMISKEKARDSSGRGQHLSHGKTIRFQNHCYRDIDAPRAGQAGEQPGDWSFDDPARAAVLQKQVEAGDVLQTTVDVLRGVSGGGLSDRQTFELVGVARSTIRNSVDVECVGSGFYTSTAAILSALATDYPHLDTTSLFQCDKNAFAPKPGAVSGGNASPAAAPSKTVPEATR